MHITFGRRTRLGVLGVSLITAAAIALSASGPALADTTDTGGSATITIPRSYLVSLAKSGVILLPGGPATSSYTAGTGNWNSSAAFTFPVTGGNGEVSNFSGVIDLGGSLAIINAAHGQTATITGLEVNFFNGTLEGIVNGGAHHVTIAYVGGNLSSSTAPGTETFSASLLESAFAAGKTLNTALATHAFVKGVNLGSFTTTYDVTISSGG